MTPEEIAESHWEYTKEIITIGMKLSSIAKLDESDKSGRDYEQIIECLRYLYKESFKHGFKHSEELKK